MFSSGVGYLLSLLRELVVSDGLLCPCSGLSNLAFIELRLQVSQD